MFKKICKSTILGVTLLGVSNNLYAGNNQNQMIGFGKTMIDQIILPKFVDDLPDWTKRIELEWQLTEDNKPEYSIWTVQPLYQSDEKKHTFFTQARLNRETVFGDSRTSSNLGLGYRSLFLDNKILVGANSFFDKGWDSNHYRVGYGVEAKWANFDFFANYYDALSDDRKIAGATERALDGYDVEIRSIVPYLPWLTVSARRYEWDSQKINENSDIEGGAATLAARISPNITIEAGMDDSNQTDKSHFIQTRFKLAEFGGSSRSSATSNFVDDKAFRLRDMSEHTMDRVRRSDKITIEREYNGSIVVRRSN